MKARNRRDPQNLIKQTLAHIQISSYFHSKQFIAVVLSLSSPTYTKQPHVSVYSIKL